MVPSASKGLHVVFVGQNSSLSALFISNSSSVWLTDSCHLQHRWSPCWHHSLSSLL